MSAPNEANAAGPSRAGPSSTGPSQDKQPVIRYQQHRGTGPEPTNYMAESLDRPSTPPPPSSPSATHVDDFSSAFVYQSPPKWEYSPPNWRRGISPFEAENMETRGTPLVDNPEHVAKSLDKLNMDDQLDDSQTWTFPDLELSPDPVQDPISLEKSANPVQDAAMGSEYVPDASQDAVNSKHPENPVKDAKNLEHSANPLQDTMTSEHPAIPVQDAVGLEDSAKPVNDEPLAQACGISITLTTPRMDPVQTDDSFDEIFGDLPAHPDAATFPDLFHFPAEPEDPMFHCPDSPQEPIKWGPPTPPPAPPVTVFTVPPPPVQPLLPPAFTTKALVAGPEVKAFWNKHAADDSAAAADPLAWLRLHGLIPFDAARTTTATVRAQLKRGRGPAMWFKPFDLFLYGLLQWPACLRVATGNRDAGRFDRAPRDVFVRGAWRLKKWGVYPVLVPDTSDPRQTVRGRLWRCTTLAQLEGVWDYETGVYALAECCVEGENGVVAAEARAFVWKGDSESPLIGEGEFDLQAALMSDL